MVEEIDGEDEGWIYKLFLCYFNLFLIVILFLNLNVVIFSLLK